MASDRGTAPELAPHDLEPAWFDCDVLHISGYSLLREPIASAAAAAAGHARAHGAHRLARRLGVDARRRRVPRTRSRRSRPISSSPPSASRRRSDALDTRWVLKRGARGLSVDGVDYPAVDVEVVDTTGAGDALAAGFLVGGAELGIATAARCCAQMGCDAVIRVSEEVRAATRGRRARDDARRARVPAGRRRRGRARVGGCRARRRRRARDDRRARRRDRRRADRRTSWTASAPTPGSSARATSPRRSRSAPSARRPSAARSRCAARPGSG